MRHHNPHSNTLDYKEENDLMIFIGAHNHHFENTTEGDNTHTYTSPGHLDISTSATFISCQWRNCSAPNGGAICLTTSTDLTVQDCIFFSCEALQNYGGAISANYANPAHVESSLFFECKAISASTSDNGGGIYIWGGAAPVLTSSTRFLNCAAKLNGGGFAMQGTFLKIAESNCYTFTDCIFINCQSSNDGGGIETWNTNFSLAVRNSLLSECSSHHGGAVYLFASHFPQGKYPILFCLFHGNMGTEGKDVFLYNCNSNLISHSFTLSPGYKRVYPEHWNEDTHQDEWLPLALPMFVSDETDNAYTTTAE